MKPIEFELVADGLAFPEGPVAMADGSVIVVEVAGGRITRCWGDGRKETLAEPGGGPNGAAVGPDGALYVCNNGGMDMTSGRSNTGPGSEGRIERIDIASGRIDRIYEAWEGVPLGAPNDIVFGSDGSLWFTDYGKTGDGLKHFGGLYRGHADGRSLHRLYHGVESLNGVGLSPDEHIVYAASTFSARLLAFDARGARAPVAPRLVATVPGLVALDSLAVAASGTVCIAQLLEGGIACVAPDGTVDVLPCPDPITTNIAFGGPDMMTAWITQSAHGRLIRCRWFEPGLRLPFNA